ncbi:secretin N-terminal domain-containing protein [Cupriavidus sp. 8B]
MFESNATKCVRGGLATRLGSACLVAAVLLLGGCAADKAFREGQGLAAQGRLEEAMAKYQEAMALNPKDVQYKMGYLRARELTIASYVERGDREAATGKPDLAEAIYRRALALDRGNERATAGMRALEAARAKTRAAATAAAGARAPAAAVAARRDGDDATGRPGDGMLSVAYKKPISIEFRDVTLKQLFEVVSRSSGLNFLFDKDVRTDQKTTVFLKNSTVESVVYFTLLTNQLEQQVLDENTVLIYPNTPNKQKDYQELMVRTFHLANTDAKMVANTLKTILKTRDVVVDDKLNMLIVRDSPEAIRLASRLVALHDVPEPEVMLEVEILEVKRDRLLNLGIAWPDSLSLTPIPSAAGGLLTLRDLTNITSSTLAAGIGPVTINAGNTDSSAKLLANPRIRARNHEKAKILIGDRVPLITTTSTATGFASESINYIDVGLKLDVEPAVHLDNDVAIKVSLEVSNIVSQLQTKSGSVAYQIGTRTASTTLRLRDGENQVLAGLISDEDRRNAKKIPGIGDLPMLGRLFGNSADENHNTEIVLSITPHLIRNIERPEPTMLTFAAGTETSLRLRPQGLTVPSARAPLIALTGQPGQGVPPSAPGPAQPAAMPVSVPAAAVIPAAPAPAAQDDDTAAASATTPAAPEARETPAANAPGSAQLRWDGAQQLKVGDTFTLQLSMQSGRPVTSVPVAITFDDKVFQAGGVVEGGFLRQGGAPTSFTSKVDTAGQLLITGTRTDNSGASGSGNFASINFRALAPANASAIQLLTAAPVGLKGSAIPAQAPAPHVVQVQP